METDYVMLVGILALLLLLFLTIFIFAVYSGLFINIDVKTCKPPFNELRVAYKFARGPYRNSSELFTEAHTYAPDQNCIGIYYDNPQEHTTMDGLRYLVGVILNTPKHEADDKIKEILLANGYKLSTFPAVDYVVMSSFPFKGTLSIMIGVARVYPELRDYVRSHKLCAHPFVEIYNDKDIIFLAPLSKQNEFYVEEMDLVDSDEGNCSVEEDDGGGSDNEKNDTFRKPFSLGSEISPKEELLKHDSDNSSIEVLHCEVQSKSCLIDETRDQIIIPKISEGTKLNVDRKSNLDKSSSSSFEELHIESNNH